MAHTDGFVVYCSSWKRVHGHTCACPAIAHKICLLIQLYIHCNEDRVTLLSCSDGSYSTGPCQAVQAYLALATIHSPLPHPGSMPVAQQHPSHKLLKHMTNDKELRLVLAERPSNSDNGICSTAVLPASIILCVNIAWPVNLASEVACIMIAFAACMHMTSCYSLRVPVHTLISCAPCKLVTACSSTSKHVQPDNTQHYWGPQTCFWWAANSTVEKKEKNRKEKKRKEKKIK